MDYYLLVVGLLFILAVADLVVGVSNDAVNFLNSSIGSRVARPRTIMMVASVGIFIGAALSSGMMEVARSGIFNPGQFVFAEVMVIFLAVMLTDIILLDAFNTLGLPTSTTVSIVFELLGAAIAVALIKMFQDPGVSQDLSTYINQEKVREIVLGIFLSIGIAFTAGVTVHYVARALFTFEYKRNMRVVGVIWSGIALSAIAYFLLIKGLKSSGLLPAEFMVWTVSHPFILLPLMALIFTLISYGLQKAGVHLLRLVVLSGTFALAMAFAGNDLVNFIGVPLAGFAAYTDWTGSGVAPENLSMKSLAGAYPAQTALLLLAGAIMVVTLWFSRKARSVTETEVNLGRQGEGNERFRSNKLSRSIVRVITSSVQFTENALPSSWRDYLEVRFHQGKMVDSVSAVDGPSFDLVRASVNLTVASVLIALATSYKLPLSTTYVTFMVAMGSSLSDRAWGRDSAVYRVAGVLQVIGGWFVTAFVAFVVAGLMALLISRFGPPAVMVLAIVAITALIASFRYHGKKEKRKKETQAVERISNLSVPEMVEQIRQHTAQTLEEIASIYFDCTDGIEKEQSRILKRAGQKMVKVKNAQQDFQQASFSAIRRIQEEKSEGSRALILNEDLENDLLQSCSQIVDLSRKHIEDVLKPLHPEQLLALREVREKLTALLNGCAQVLRQSNFKQRKKIQKEKRELLSQIENLLSLQAAGIQQHRYGSRNSVLFFNLMLESKDIVAVAFRFIKLHSRLQESMESGATQSFIADPDATKDND